MPVNLTDADEFTAAVQVPAPADQAGLTYLLTAFQALANRTRYLYNAALAKTLQDLFDQSVVATVAAVDVGTDSLELGDVTIDSDGLSVASNKLTISDHPSVQSALVVPATSGSTTLTALYEGAFTPTVSAVTGSNVDVGDFTSLSGHLLRLGSTVFFSLEGTINSTGWTSGTATFALPVAGTISGSVAAPVTCYAVANFDELYLTNAAGNTALLLNFATSVPGTNMFFYASGSYRLA